MTCHHQECRSVLDNPLRMVRTNTGSRHVDASGVIREQEYNELILSLTLCEDLWCQTKHN